MSKALVAFKGKSPSTGALLFEVTHTTPGKYGTHLSYDLSLSYNLESWKAEMEPLDSHRDCEDGNDELDSSMEAINRLADRLERMAQALRSKSSSIGRFTDDLARLERSEKIE